MLAQLDLRCEIWRVGLTWRGYQERDAPCNIIDAIIGQVPSSLAQVLVTFREHFVDRSN